MPSERIQGRIDRLLDQAADAADARDWECVLQCARSVLAAEPENEDALVFVSMVEAARRELGVSDAPPAEISDVHPASRLTPDELPTSFANGRYQLKDFLGEGGKRRVW